MNVKLLHPADQIVMIMNRIYTCGMTTTSGGNLSILDDNGDVWISPGSVDKGTLTRRDIICVKQDGTMLGPHKPSCELPFHQTIYRMRPDVRAVMHAHPPALVAFSLVRRIPNTRILPSAFAACGEPGMAPYAVPGSAELGEKIAAVFAKGYDMVMLENHGAVVAKPDLFQAFAAFETLDFCARAEMDAVRIGTPVALDDAALARWQAARAGKPEEFAPTGHSSAENDARREMAALIQRSYEQRLFTSTQGTISVKLDDDSFLIMPRGMDRRYLTVEDLVVVRAGKAEAGKTPCAMTPLHTAIYAAQPHVRSVITAQPPNLMAFAVTGAPMDSRTIPESYIMLRNVQRLPFAAGFEGVEQTARVFRPSTPVALIANNCAVATGTSMINAFDRLEVGEYSAKAIIATGGLGKLVAITDDQVKEIDVAFGLEN